MGCWGGEAETPVWWEGSHTTDMLFVVRDIFVDLSVEFLVRMSIVSVALGWLGEIQARKGR